MNFKIISYDNDLWQQTARYAASCSWRAGKALSEKMLCRDFSDWERVIVAVENNRIVAYCTVAKDDCIPNVAYTPYIGFVFVDEEYRGHRISKRLIDYAEDYLKYIGFDKVYLVSDHINFYEKYGFKVIDVKTAPWGTEEKIYMKKLI